MCVFAHNFTVFGPIFLEVYDDVHCFTLFSSAQRPTRCETDRRPRAARKAWETRVRERRERFVCASAARPRKRGEKKTGEKAAAAAAASQSVEGAGDRDCCGGGGDVTLGGLVPLACGTPHWLSAKHTAPSDRRRHRHRHRQTVGAADETRARVNLHSASITRASPAAPLAPPPVPPPSHPSPFLDAAATAAATSSSTTTFPSISHRCV